MRHYAHHEKTTPVSKSLLCNNPIDSTAAPIFYKEVLLIAYLATHLQRKELYSHLEQEVM